MKPPILVNESNDRREVGDCSVYATVEALRDDIEPWYAEESYFAFDIEGRALRLRPDDERYSVHVVPIDGAAPDPGLVRRYLLHLLAARRPRLSDTDWRHLNAPGRFSNGELASILLAGAAQR